MQAALFVVAALSRSDFVQSFEKMAKLYAQQAQCINTHYGVLSEEVSLAASHAHPDLRVIRLLLRPRLP